MPFNLSPYFPVIAMDTETRTMQQLRHQRTSHVFYSWGLEGTMLWIHPSHALCFSFTFLCDNGYVALLLSTLYISCYRSGKSSIQKVVFHKMSPNETLFLESTSKIIKDGEGYDI